MITALAAAAAALALPASLPDDAARQIVEIHNIERRQVGNPPIQWDDALASDAVEWAHHLARRDDLVHWSEENGDNGQGENLWLGTRGYFSIGQMVGGWTSEKKPLARMASWEDDYQSVGHYTQMVWRETRKVGCAIASNPRNDILVCRYWPAGNVMGEHPYAPMRLPYATTLAALP